MRLPSLARGKGLTAAVFTRTLRGDGAHGFGRDLSVRLPMHFINGDGLWDANLHSDGIAVTIRETYENGHEPNAFGFIEFVEDGRSGSMTVIYPFCRLQS